MRQRIMLSLILGFLAGCERAGRYPARTPIEPPAPKVAEDKPTLPSSYMAWRDPRKPEELPYDPPIVFVTYPSKEWYRLPKFWNVSATGAGDRPAFIPTLSPLNLAILNRLPYLGVGALINLNAGLQITVKVPRGLPDPRALIPAANPPTYAKWKLGKELFFEKILHVDPDLSPSSCASCHKPEKRFMDGRPRAEFGAMNIRTPTLINVLYNRHQFWDGRVKNLEEVVTRDLSDEIPPVKAERFSRHVFGGVVKKMEDDPYFNRRFVEVFGVPPTQDLIGKALATYMRTILSGNSPVDLDTASKFDKGRQLFTGKANCAVCHPAKDGLYTDHDFHNIGLPDFHPGLTLEGRLAQVPSGVKESRLQGAFRTPSLRNLVFGDDACKEKRLYFMHEGVSFLRDKVHQQGALYNVIEHFNSAIIPNPYGVQNPYLSPALLDKSGKVRKLELTDSEIQTLVEFLEALESDPVDPIVLPLPKK